MDGPVRTGPGLGAAESQVVLPPLRCRNVTALPDVPGQRIEGGLDRKGLFTPDSKGAFSDPNLRVFTPVLKVRTELCSLGAKQGVRLENGTHLLIVVQPPASSPDVR